MIVAWIAPIVVSHEGPGSMFAILCIFLQLQNQFDKANSIPQHRTYGLIHYNRQLGYRKNRKNNILHASPQAYHASSAKRIPNIHNHAHHLTKTSNQAPVIPIPMPVATTTNHILHASISGPDNPLTRRRWRRWRSAASSSSQSIVLPSGYLECLLELGISL
jgi:hypothetical protein